MSPTGQHLVRIELSICITKAHGGKIKVEKEGEGSEFISQLPLNNAS
jgi:signal transduction histidine kinase